MEGGVDATLDKLHPRSSLTSNIMLESDCDLNFCVSFYQEIVRAAAAAGREFYVQFHF